MRQDFVKTITLYVRQVSVSIILTRPSYNRKNTRRIYRSTRFRCCEALDRVDKDIIARYIGLMRKRLTRRDVEATSTMDEQIRQYPWDELQRQLAYTGRFGAALQVPQAKEHFLSEYGRTKLLRESMLQPFGRAHEALMHTNWSFQVAAGGEYFITSDNPVVFDEGAGLLNSSLLFPISQRVILLATWTQGTDLSYTDVAADEVRKLNSLVVITATNEIYSPKPDEWIHQGWEHGFKWP